MTTAADFACYIQPIHTNRLKELGTAWVDTSKTAVLRRRVTSADEAIALVNEARQVAAALGGEMVIKKVVTTAWDADRAPARVKRLAGNEFVGVEVENV